MNEKELWGVAVIPETLDLKDRVQWLLDKLCVHYKWVDDGFDRHYKHGYFFAYQQPSYVSMLMERIGYNAFLYEIDADVEFVNNTPRAKGGA